MCISKDICKVSALRVDLRAFKWEARNTEWWYLRTDLKEPRPSLSRACVTWPPQSPTFWMLSWIVLTNFVTSAYILLLGLQRRKDKPKMALPSCCVKICDKRIWNQGVKMDGVMKPTGHDRRLKWEAKQEWNLEGNSRKTGHYIIKAFDDLCHFDGVVFAFETFLEVNFREEVGKKKIKT